jgi:hypothetical protein
MQGSDTRPDNHFKQKPRHRSPNPDARLAECKITTRVVTISQPCEKPTKLFRRHRTPPSAPLLPLRETSSRPLANRASGTIGGEKAMRAMLEWRAGEAGSDEGCAEPATHTTTKSIPDSSPNPHRCHPGFIPGRGTLAVLGSFSNTCQGPLPDKRHQPRHATALLVLMKEPTPTRIPSPGINPG